MTALHYACDDGAEEVIDKLVDQGADVSFLNKVLKTVYVHMIFMLYGMANAEAAIGFRSLKRGLQKEGGLHSLFKPMHAQPLEIHGTWFYTAAKMVTYSIIYCSQFILLKCL